MDDRLGEALLLWRGEAFAGLDTPWINALRDTVEAERVAAQLDHADLRLRQGQHAALLPELTSRAAARPLDERVTGQLMLALYRAGRQADALTSYDRLRWRLAEELGADPTPTLRQLHRHILNADPALDIPVLTRLVNRPVPQQLPLAPTAFAGRGDELARLSSVAAETAGGPVVITGAGGIGKTWLALHWAHRNAERFPGGQLFVDLRGFAQAGGPVPAAIAVRGFLDALGVDPAQLPGNPDAHAALYRSLVAGRRMLIMLDNACDAGQVTALLPGSPTCTVLVTGRDRMASLITTHGASTLALDALPEAEARALLVQRLGLARIEAEPRAVTDLLTYCAGSPLALGIVAARATSHPGFPLETWAVELRDAATRLDALDDGDTMSLSAVLSWSYTALNPRQAEVFGLLGLAPGPDVSLAAAASLAGASPEGTRSSLRSLDRMSLVDEHVPGRWRMHDLIRLHAVDRCARDQPDVARESALRRLVDHYIHTAVAADRLLAPHRTPIELEAPAPGCRPDALADESAAVAWFTAEHECLLAAQRHAAEHGRHHAVWQLAWALDTVHSRRGYLHDRLAAWRAVETVVQHLDPDAQIVTHRTIGRACARLGQHAEALRHLRLALAGAEGIGDLANQANTHRAFAWALARHGDNERALEHATRALHTFRTLDNPLQQARALNSMGWYATSLGRYEQARTHCEAALTLFRVHHDGTGNADAQDSLGHLAHHTGAYAEAVDHYRQALRHYRDTGDISHEADCLTRLGHSHAALGRPTLARDSWCQALLLYQAQHRTEDAQRVQAELNTLAGLP